MKKLFILFIAVAGFSGSSFALPPDSKTAVANATARIVTPITIHKDGDLAFGLIGTPTITSHVLMTSQGVASVVVDGGDATLPTGNVPRTAASFTVTGDANATYAITLPANGTVSLAGGGTAMPVNNFKAFSTTVNAEGVVGQLGASPTTDVITVGATLTVNADQLADTYSNTFSVTVDYN